MLVPFSNLRQQYSVVLWETSVDGRDERRVGWRRREKRRRLDGLSPSPHFGLWLCLPVAWWNGHQWKLPWQQRTHGDAGGGREGNEGEGGWGVRRGGRERGREGGGREGEGREEGGREGEGG